MGQENQHLGYDKRLAGDGQRGKLPSIARPPLEPFHIIGIINLHVPGLKMDHAMVLARAICCQANRDCQAVQASVDLQAAEARRLRVEDEPEMSIERMEEMLAEMKETDNPLAGMFEAILARRRFHHAQEVAR